MHSRREPYAEEPYFWKQAVEAAMAEHDVEARQQMLFEASQAVLQRARKLEDSGGSDAECFALEQAAESLQQMKLSTQTDGSPRDGGTEVT